MIFAAQVGITSTHHLAPRAVEAVSRLRQASLPAVVNTNLPVSLFPCENQILQVGVAKAAELVEVDKMGMPQEVAVVAAKAKATGIKLSSKASNIGRRKGKRKLRETQVKIETAI